MDEGVGGIRAYSFGYDNSFVGVDILSLKTWWADDWHIIPRWSRDLYCWLKGKQYERVDYAVMTYDPVYEEEHIDTVRISRKDLPHLALHVTGKGDRSFLEDKDGQGEWPAPGSMDAHGLYLFTISDAIDDALERRKPSLLDMVDGKMIAMVGAAIAAIVIIYTVVL